MANKNKKVDWNDVLDEFRGRGKIAAIKISEPKKGVYRLHYEENGQTSYVDWHNRDELADALVEFGGKNADTVAAPDKFLKIGDWNSEDLNELGHRITKIKIVGEYQVRNSSIPIDLPKKCGQAKIIDAKKQTDDLTITKHLKDREHGSITISFRDSQQFDNLVKELQSNQHFRNWNWSVETMGTESRTTCQQCLWVRESAGDGTRRMTLQLKELDGKDYTECLPSDLRRAADDMFDTDCRKIPGQKKPPTPRKICFWAAQEGRVG